MRETGLSEPFLLFGRSGLDAFKELKDNFGFNDYRLRQRPHDMIPVLTMQGLN